MIYWLSVYMNFSVCIAAVIAVARIGKMDPVYLPFILYLWIAFLNEIIHFTLVRTGHSAIPYDNICLLLQGMLILWQFKAWGLFNDAAGFPILLAILLAATWFYEIHSIYTLNKPHYYYRLFYPTLMVVCSINLNNRLIFSHNHRLLTNPVFLICIAFVLHFTLTILTDAYWLYNPKSSTRFLLAVFYSKAGNNLLQNLLFIMAVLWIPRKPEYISF